MEIRTLALLILRAIAVTGSAVSLIMLSFSQQLLQSHEISTTDQSPLSKLLIILAFTVPVALWIFSPSIVRRAGFVKNTLSVTIDLHDILVLVIVISAVSLITRGLVETIVSVLSTLTLNTAPNAVLVVDLEQGGSFGLRGTTQIICGAVLLWLAPLLTGNLTKILVRRPQ